MAVQVNVLRIVTLVSSGVLSFGARQGKLSGRLVLVSTRFPFHFPLSLQVQRCSRDRHKASVTAMNHKDPQQSL